MNSIRVLYVDDDPDFGGLVRDLLEREDERFEVVSETSAPDGLDRLSDGERDIDCIVSDYDMPRMDGIEFLDAVRTEYPDLPFILFTGQGSEAVASDAIASGATNYLRKSDGTEQFELLANQIDNAVERYRAQREQHRAYVENASDVLGVVGDDGVFKGLSPSIERVTGHAPDELVGESVFDYVHPEDRERVVDQFVAMLTEQTDQPRRVEYRFEHADGSWLWLESAGRNRKAPHLDGYVITTREITDRREYEQSLREQNRKITALHRVAGEIENCDDSEAVYETVVDAAEDILQLDIAIADAAVGETLIPRAISSDLSVDQYYDETPVDSETNLAAEAYRTGESILIEDLDQHDSSPAAGEFRSVLTVPIGEYGVFQSVEQEPEAFDERDRELTELLVSRAEARLDQLETERQLREQTEKLSQQNDRLEEFTSVVSHDLRNPLNLATTSLELVKDDCDSEHIDRVERGHDQMEALIDNLLALAKDGEAVGEFDVVDLAALSRDCWRTVDTEDATLRTDLDSSIQADRNRLRQLLSNLMRNAVEHGPTGPASDTQQDAVEHGATGSEEEGASGVTVRVGDLPDGFYVEDDGPGIPEDERDSVFESGYTTAADGTGFGLSIVAEVVDAHDWSLELTESEAGGARFEIRDVSVQ